MGWSTLGLCCLNYTLMFVFNNAQCLESMKRCELVLRTLAEREYTPPLFKNQEVVDIILNIDFWTRLKLLCDILEPASKVVMGIQGKAALLADVPRYWAYMARALEEKLQPALAKPGAWRGLMYAIVGLEHNNALSCNFPLLTR